ncbi:MAG: Dipeptidylaminopeptidase/acylaminoacyl-peptidase -like protein [Verrucomicrobiales bacterium]|nr:Dipeptidylaminopeptidase/acylaminoacyl-peptidase -like protein [Verrucomicrobiales bacterium]
MGSGVPYCCNSDGMTLRILIVAALVANVFVFASRCSKPLPRAQLLESRVQFHTVLNGVSFKPNGLALEPPSDIYNLVRYPSPVGDLAAYVSPEPLDGVKRPAVIWAHGGFGGLREYAWTPEDDQSPRAFLNKDFVVMVPSWRRENDNPGSFEFFLGEVDDMLAAVQYLRSLRYVDSDRIYIVGYSIGGTLALLAAESTNTFRAAFSIGAATDVARLLADGEGDGLVPFDARDEKEIAIRNPIRFTESIQVPTFYFEGGNSWEAPDACKMELVARKAGRPFHSVIVPGAHHWSILQPASALIAEKIRGDTGPECRIQISVEEARAVYNGMSQPQQVFD